MATPVTASVNTRSGVIAGSSRPGARFGAPRAIVGPAPPTSAREDHAGAVPEQPLVDRQPRGRALDLALPRLTPQLPRELAHLGNRLRGDRLPEARESAARVDGHAPTE